MNAAFGIILAITTATLYFFNPIFHFNASHVVTLLCGILLVPSLKLLFRMVHTRNLKSQSEGSDNTIYGLDHGRLHVRLPLPMWMNMGYWNKSDIDDERLSDSTTTKRRSTKSLAVASKDLLSEVLATAGFSKEKNINGGYTGKRRTKALLDLGFGCGDQTIYLTSLCDKVLRPSDQEWWDSQPHVPRFDSYTGITLDRKQFQCAQVRVQELLHEKTRDVRLFCGDAGRPEAWDSELKNHVHERFSTAQERWVLALDTLYHFSPSRWQIIKYASRTLDASFMSFDLCLADNVSLRNLVLLQLLTTLMGARWANFVTKEQYRTKLVEAGYRDVVVRDVSEDVFEGLAEFLGEQDRVLGAIGFGLGGFRVARWMFGWWGGSGCVRGVIFIARK